MDHTYIATCKFGLEGLVAEELRVLGAHSVRTENARVFFSGNWDILCAANLWLRTGDRVFLLLGEFPATTFDELFEGVKAIEWEALLEKDAQFPVKGKTAKSILHSVSDCQAITKKAIVERMKTKHKVNWFAETGCKYIVEVGLLDDVATIALDASGAGLARRGYRTLNVEAPLSETLAAAIVDISRWRSDRPLWDPMCGSGTIPIEAAMLATHRAPGLTRDFALQEWGFLPNNLLNRARSSAQDAFTPSAPFEIMGSDIDETALELSRFHAKNAGFERIKFFHQDVREIKSQTPGGTILCNPPYGERLLDKKTVEQLYAQMGAAFMALPNWKYCILSSHPQFERMFGKRADKRRKLYNSSIVCQLYQYFYQKQK